MCKCFRKLYLLKTLLPNISRTTRSNLGRMSFTTSSIGSPNSICAGQNSLTIGTHSGTFHCDEVLACFMLKQLPEYENAKIIRSRNITELRNLCDIIVDVGGEFDHKKKLYDHHQRSFQETLSTLRPELGSTYNIRLSSAGLVFCFYGDRVIDTILKKHANISLTSENLKLTFNQLYSTFISEIDAIDNGVHICANGEEPIYKIYTHLSKRVDRLNIGWHEECTNVDDRFEKAMAYVGNEFVENVLSIGGPWIKAREYVRKALETAKDVHDSGEILLLEVFCPWKHHLHSLEKEYHVEGTPKLVIFDDTYGQWRVAGVPVTPDSFLGRKFLPEPWRGLREKELSQLAGIEGLKFVHHSGFIGGAQSKEAAIAMAIKSLQWGQMDKNK